MSLLEDVQALLEAIVGFTTASISGDSTNATVMATEMATISLRLQLQTSDPNLAAATKPSQIPTSSTATEHWSRGQRTKRKRNATTAAELHIMVIDNDHDSLSSSRSSTPTYTPQPTPAPTLSSLPPPAHLLSPEIALNLVHDTLAAIPFPLLGRPILPLPTRHLLLPPPPPIAATPPPPPAPLFPIQLAPLSAQQQDTSALLCLQPLAFRPHKRLRNSRYEMSSHRAQAGSSYQRWDEGDGTSAIEGQVGTGTGAATTNGGEEERGPVNEGEVQSRVVAWVAGVAEEKADGISGRRGYVI